MKVKTVKNLLTGDAHEIFVAETAEERRELEDAALEDDVTRRPLTPGPDGLPYVKRLPVRPRGAGPWVVHLLAHDSQPIWQPELANGTIRPHPRPPEAPVFYTFAEGHAACRRAAARLGVAFRDSM